MSLQDMLHPADPPPPAAEASASAKDAKAPMRSWRKKYRKLKLRFDKVMEESNQLFMDEHKEIARARRLQEENDQLLEKLLDFNDNPHIPSKYELSLPGDEDLGLNSRLRSWPSDPSNLHRLSHLLDTVPHTESSSSLPLPTDMTGDKPPAYLDSAYEEEYLTNLDAQLPADEELLLHGEFLHPVRPPLSRNLPSEKELSAQNPNSVISWLKRHHPETFIQEKEQANSERSIAKPRGPGKRGSLASAATLHAMPAPKSDRGGTGEGADDDDASFAGEAMESRPGGRGKKNMSRDDEAYRPKGGSSRGSKRKRPTGDDGETPKTGGRGKRAKPSAASAAVD